MKELLLYILKLRSLLLFVFLESICLFLVFRYNNSQREIFLNSANVISGFFHEQTNVVKSFFELREENENIAAKNAKLLQQIYKGNIGGGLVEGEFLVDSLYVMRAARVISNSIHGARNTFLLNAGSNQGIKPKMGVVNADGVLGITKNVGRNYTTVTSVLNLGSHISAKLQNIEVPGVIDWIPGDHRFVMLQEIPKHYSEISVGDTIVTSGFSTIFPPDMPIGRINELISETGNNFYKIKVELFADLATIKLVYVIEHLDQEEIEDLQEDE